LDEWLSGVKVHGNVIAHTYFGGVGIHGGRDNVIENNILVDGSVEQVRLESMPRDDMLIDMFNIVRRNRYPQYPELATIKDPQKDSGMANNKFVRNIVAYSSKTACLYELAGADPDDNEFDFNVISHTGPPRIAGVQDLASVPLLQQWPKWRKGGQDKNSTKGSSLFEDPARDDYRFRTG